MNNNRIQGSATWDVGLKFGLAELNAFISKLPPEAVLTIRHYPGDQRDPGYTQIVATWDL